MAWTYSDWITKSPGSSDRISRFRLHVQEVADAIQTGSYSVDGRSVSKAELQSYLQVLLNREVDESAVYEQTQAASGSTTSRIGWSRLRANL